MLTIVILGWFLGGDPASGPKVGDALPAAKVQGAYAPDEGKKFDLLDRGKKDPTLIVFVHKLTRPTYRLLKKLDESAAKHDKLHTAFVWLTDDIEKTEQFLKVASGSLKFQTPVSISLDGVAGPNGYGLNDLAGVTIVLANEGKVTATFAYADPNETVAPKIVEAIERLTPK